MRVIDRDPSLEHRFAAGSARRPFAVLSDSKTIPEEAEGPYHASRYSIAEGTAAVHLPHWKGPLRSDAYSIHLSLKRTTFRFER